MWQHRAVTEMKDWHEWHARYAEDTSALSRRLRLVQRHIDGWLDERPEVRRWFDGAGFTERAFHAPPDVLFSVGVHLFNGEWYATAMAWRPYVAAPVDGPTLRPLLMPLAPAVTPPARVGAELAAVLTAHALPDAVVEEGLRRMRE